LSFSFTGPGFFISRIRSMAAEITPPFGRDKIFIPNEGVFHRERPRSSGRVEAGTAGR
jgi:hypothetical protein